MRTRWRSGAQTHRPVSKVRGASRYLSRLRGILAGARLDQTQPCPLQGAERFTLGHAPRLSPI
jgi:hypothetical protein